MISLLRGARVSLAFARRKHVSFITRDTQKPRRTTMAAKKKAKKAKAAKPKAKAKKAPAKKSKRKPNPAFMKPMTPSPALAAVIGPKARPRSQVAKSIWDYIKKNKLQDSKNRRMINADANLKTVFGGRGQVSMFEMTKLVSKHLS
jgi:upstream activation factor subunit UAF30